MRISGRVNRIQSTTNVKWLPPKCRWRPAATGIRPEAGADGIEVFCNDHKCSHCVKMSADTSPDHMRLSDIEGQMVCKACGRRGADVRPDYHGSQRPAMLRQ
jgi:hypothetical protein